MNYYLCILHIFQTEVLSDWYLFMVGQPDPDLIIRTAGELRVSNFLIWQGAYAEYYAADVYWPDFDKDQFRRALDHYAARERRYGLVSAQVNKAGQANSGSGHAQ